MMYACIYSASANTTLKNTCSYVRVYIIEAILLILRYHIILGHYVATYVMSVATYVRMYVYTYERIYV